MKRTAVSLLVHLHENPWTFAAFTSLAIGGWFYLLAKEQKKRFLALVGGATVAMWIDAIGKWIIVPKQSLPMNLESERWFETVYTIGSWIITIAALIAPASLNLLPPSPRPTVEEAISSG